jgi:hypothetical protein
LSPMMSSSMMQQLSLTTLNTQSKCIRSYVWMCGCGCVCVCVCKSVFLGMLRDRIKSHALQGMLLHTILCVGACVCVCVCVCMCVCVYF